jgi:hypothetical protein
MHPNFDTAPRPFAPEVPTTAALLVRGDQAIREAQEVCRETRELIRVVEEMRTRFRRAHGEEILA